MDKKIIDLVYRCYLAETRIHRLAAICELMKEHNGKEFFEKYSTPNDSIMKFLERAEEQGLELW